MGISYHKKVGGKNPNQTRLKETRYHKKGGKNQIQKRLKKTKDHKNILEDLDERKINVTS